MTEYVASVYLRGPAPATGEPGDRVGRFSFTLPGGCRSRVVEMVAENHVLELGYLPVWGGAVLRGGGEAGDRREVEVFVQRRSLVSPVQQGAYGRGPVWCDSA